MGKHCFRVPEAYKQRFHISAGARPITMVSLSNMFIQHLSVKYAINAYHTKIMHREIAIYSADHCIVFHSF